MLAGRVLRLLLMKTSTSRASIPGIAVALFVFILPFVNSRALFYAAVNSKYFFVVAAVSIFALYFCYLLFGRKHTIDIRGRWLLVGVLGLLAVHYLSALFGVYPERSLWSDIIRSTGVFFLTYGAFFAFWLSELLTERDWQLVRRAVVVSSSVFAALSFFGPEGAGVAGRLWSVDFTISGLTLGNSTFAGAYLVLGLIVTLIEAARSPKGSRLRRAFAALAIIQLLSPFLIAGKIWEGGVSFADIFSNPSLVLGIARASSATAILVLLYVFGWWLLRRFCKPPWKRPALWVWSGAWALGVLAAIAFLFVPGSVVQEKYIEASSAARIIVWERGFEAVSDRPLLGWGPENYRFAHEAHIDSELYLKENLGEVWFDRAHNVVVDMLVSVGIIGTLAFVLLVSYFLVVIARARRRGLIGDAEAHLLGVLVFAHFLQLQTSFDTVATYVLVAVILGYGLWLEREMARVEIHNNNSADSAIHPAVLKVAGVVLTIAVLFGAKYLLFDEYSRQRALVDIFRTRKNQEQIELANRALTRTSAFESLRLSSASLIKGLLAVVREAEKQGELETLRAIAKEQSDVYEAHYLKYIEEAPWDYRAQTNYAYLLLNKTAFGENRTADTKSALDEVYRLVSPNNPIPYGLDALNELYSGNIKDARAKIEEALAKNPDVPFLQEMLKYIGKQEEQFPTITILHLDNL